MAPVPVLNKSACDSLIFGSYPVTFGELNESAAETVDTAVDGRRWEDFLRAFCYFLLALGVISEPGTCHGEKCQVGGQTRVEPGVVQLV
jgi:hypothetical protein